jgi:hypothetical protein
MALGLRSAAVLAAVLGFLAGCGDGEDLIGESSLQDCLAGEGLRAEAPDLAASASLGNVSPDFRVLTTEGTGVDMIVQGSEERARRTAADIRGALQAFGATDSVVLARRNAIAVFEQAPTDASRQAVERCLAA